MPNKSDIAKYIGITENKLNDWIRKGLVIGITEKNDELPEDTELTFTRGRKVSISTLKSNWKRENQTRK